MATILERLAQHATRMPQKTAITLLGDDNRAVDTLSYGELYLLSVANGQRFSQLIESGSRVVLSYPTTLDFAIGFFACLYANLVPVPTPSVRGNRYRRSVMNIAHDCGASLILCEDISDEGARLLANSLDREPEQMLLSVSRTFETSDVPSHAPAVPLAYLQYTSGSTSDPKGVVVSHANLTANLEMMSVAFAADGSDDVVGWAPLYHDMGLVANLLHPIWRGASCILMSPGAFAAKPWRWLQAIDAFGATISGGPNYAYELCIARARQAISLDLNLSRWRIAFNSAEPVRASTIHDFNTTYASTGFRQTAMYPCYGMAEATLLVAGGNPASSPRIELLSRAALSSGSACEPLDLEDRLDLVGCGKSLQGETIIIVDPVSHRRCDERQVGEIWVSGPNVPSSYWGAEAKSCHTYGAQCPDVPDASFLRTGDLGFIDCGELFFAGRIKDTIVLRGRNLYPQDIEYLAERSQPGLKFNGAALFAVERANTTQPDLVLIQEVEREFRGDIDTEACAMAIRRAVFAEFGVSLATVLLVNPGQIPKTSSGKTRRAATRQAYLSSQLRPIVGKRELSKQPGEVGADL